MPRQKKPRLVTTTPVFHELLRTTTHKNLAKIIGVSRSMITSIATNQRIPSLPIALKIAKHFNKSVDELFMLKTAESKFSPDKEAQLLG